MSNRLAIIVNAKGGTAQSLDSGSLSRDLEAAFPDAVVVTANGSNVPEIVHATFQNEAYDRVIVAGGDGTVSLAAKQSVETAKPFGVIPLGTMNLFARTIDMPLDPGAAIVALADARIRDLDVGEANGETFVNHVSIGFHPQLIRMRDGLPERAGKRGRARRIWDAVRVWWRLMETHSRYRLEVTGDFPPFSAKAGLAVVSINPVRQGVAQVPVPEGQRAGVLGVYVSTHKTAWELNKVLYRIAAGTLAESDHITINTSQTCRIDTDTALHMSIDGEVFVTQPPIDCRVRRRGLKVLVPRRASHEDEAISRS